MGDQIRKQKEVAERLTKCPKCFAVEPNIIKIHNPETSDMNANATLECWDCLYIWEGKTSSPRYEEDKSKGWIM